MKKEYPDLVSQERPTTYNYDNKALENEGFKHRYSLNHKNPTLEQICADLKSEDTKYRIVTPPDRLEMRDVWVLTS